MDQIIAKYDYANATKETELSLDDELNSTTTEANLSLSGLKNIINIFIKKICVKEFAKNQPRYSPGTWMASITMRDLSSLVDGCIENGTIPLSDAQDCLFDLFLAMVRIGPGTSHFEVIEKLVKTSDMNIYLKNITGEKLRQMVSALKEYTYTPEKDMTINDYESLMNTFLPRLVKYFVEDREDSKASEVWTHLLDLYLFYLLQTSNVPDELQETMRQCSNIVVRAYNGGNPYQEFSDDKVLKEHVKKIATFILSADFKNEIQLNLAIDYVYNLTQIEGRQLESMWPELMSILKALCLSEKAKEMETMIEKFKFLFDKMDAKILEKNHKIFEEWAITITEITDKIKYRKLLELIVPRMVSDLEKKYKPAKGDEKYWFLLVKAIWSVPTSEMQQRVQNMLRDDKFKRMWTWKSNIQEAKDMIAVVEKLDLPTDGDDWEERDSNSNCGDAVKELLSMLRIQKIDHLIMPELVRMSLTYMEKRSILSNYMVTRYIGDTNLEKVPELATELIRRLEPLITDADYPWLDGWCFGNGVKLYTLTTDAFKSGNEIPDEINEAIIRILDFCMRDDCELINISNGIPTVWGMILQLSPVFITKHCLSGTADICFPVLEKLLKFRCSEEECQRQPCLTSIQIAGQQAPNVCVKFLNTLLDWYAESHQSFLMQIFYRIAEVNPDAIFKNMDMLISSCKDDSETYQIQATLFQILSTKRPQLFTKDMVDMLFEKHYHNKMIRIQILIILANIVKVNHTHIVKHMNNLLNDKSILAVEQHFVNGILVSVAKQYEKFRDPVFNYLMNLLKLATDESQIQVTITGLKDMCIRYGPEMFNSHKDYILQRREREHNTNIIQTLTGLIDQIEGRSLETVAQDVKDTQEDVEQLDTRVTGTAVVVGTLTTRMDKHDDDIQGLGEGLDTVTQRVDFAEKDIEETKIKVAEIDNKTMTNAPRWSRDLTKLMNPADEHDWRLLAQRLGYNNDDIRAWATQHDPCMAVLSEWYATHKTREATHAVLTALQEMNRMDGAAIVENAMKAAEDVIEDEEVDYPSPPPVFLSYQWGHQEEVKLIRNHLQMAGYECWMDIGQMGGGDKLFEKIDNGIRGAKVVICCVSEKYAPSPNCNREVNLSVSLGKPMIPLLMEKMNWPPKGSMGPIFSEYLFVRFFQRPGEETDDNRFWPKEKFQEVLMQLNCYNITPDELQINDMYKNWWIPIEEVIVIDKDKSKKKENQSQAQKKENKDEGKKSPDVFLSYQWGKQKQIIALHQRLTSVGLSCWMDIYQMGGGDSLYEKIDSGVRGCKVVLTCITPKYSLSANCRREVSLADALQKPIIPLLLEKMEWPPSGPMSMVFTQLLFVNFYRDEEIQFSWKGAKFDELLQKIGEHIPVLMQNADDSQMETVNEKENSNCIQRKETSSVSTQHSKDSRHNGNAEKNVDSNKSLNVSLTNRKAEKSSDLRPVSQKGMAGPQPTEKRPSPVRQVKPNPVQQTNVESGSSSQQDQKSRSKTTYEDSPKLNNKQGQQPKPSTSCTLL